MGQKVNTLNLRLKKRINWTAMFCAHNMNDYTYLFLNLNTMLKTSQTNFFNLNLMQGYNSIKKTAKKYNIKHKLLNQQVFFYLFKRIYTNKKTITNMAQLYNFYVTIFKTLNKRVMFNNNNLILKTGSVNAQKKFINKPLNSSFLTIPPAIFTKFIKWQLTEINWLQLKQHNFKQSLQKNLLSVITLFLQQFKYKITGLKIICKGRWQKTGNGKTQKIYLRYGQIKTVGFTNKILYDTIIQKTKFGICSVKIWIAHN